MSQEVAAQNHATSSFNASNIFDDVALVTKQLDCLGLSYNPDSIANMLIEEDGSTDRVAIVLNKIIDFLTSGIGFDTNSADEAETCSNIIQVTENIDVIGTKKNRSELMARDTSSPDYEPSPSKLFKPNPEDPKENLFSQNLPKKVGSIRVKNFAELSAASSSSILREDDLSNDALPLGGKKKGSISVKKSTDLCHASSSSAIREYDSSNEALPAVASADLNKLDAITGTVSNSLKVPISISKSSLSRVCQGGSATDQLSKICECMSKVELQENELNIIDNLIDFLIRKESNGTTNTSMSSSKSDANISGSTSKKDQSVMLSATGSESNLQDAAIKPVACSSQSSSQPFCVYFANLMEIFPDADTTYLRDLCRDCDNREILPLEEDILQHLIDKVLENPEYPRRTLPNLEESEVPMTSEDRCRNIIAILPDIDPEFVKEKCKELSDESYNIFVNELLTTEAYPTIKNARMRETSNKIKAYMDNPSIPDFLQVFPNPEDYFMNQKMSSHPEHSLAFLKDRFSLLRSDDIVKVYRSEGFNLTRTCRKLDGHTGPVCKRRRTIQDCKWPAKNDVNFLQEIFYILNWQEIKQYIEDKNREQKFASQQQTVNRCNDIGTSKTVPEKSDLALAAFGLFLRSPFEFSRVLQRSKEHAESIVKLFLTAPNAGGGGNAPSSLLADNLPTLPFEELKTLLASAPMTSDQGVYIRQVALDRGVVHSILACLAALTHNSEYINLPDVQLKPSTCSKQVKNKVSSTVQTYDYARWAKGTGYGTGSTAQSWNLNKALTRQKCEESHLTVLIQILSYFIDPKTAAPLSAQNADAIEGTNFPVNLSAGKIAPKLSPLFHELLEKSCLVQVLSSYLRNDSVLDMMRHIPIYRAIMCLLRVIASNDQYVDFLFPRTSNQESSISSLLSRMKNCVDIYSVNVGTKMEIKTEDGKFIDKDEEELASLIQDIQHTAMLIASPMESMIQNGKSSSSIERPLKTVEDRYLDFMKALQFEEYDIIIENCDTNGLKFAVSYHYEQNILALGHASQPSRVKRLAQEVVTVRSPDSLPLSYSSSVFVRCDSSRLDVMKVLITGPAETPYMNGCFEFDVFFPKDYPSSPLNINLETTGRKTVRFNPNLYNDGKVCLSILNTWRGRPEEQWNPQTSNILQVLISIQSLILVPEPYFNEPGYERLRGTPTGTRRSHTYNISTFQNTLKWAMIGQLRNPSLCFRTVIQSHFWLKRDEIYLQVEKWIAEIESDKYQNQKNLPGTVKSLRDLLKQLQGEISKLTAPAGLEDLNVEVSKESSGSSQTVTDNQPPFIAEAGPSSRVEEMEVTHPFMSDYATDAELDEVLLQLMEN